MTQQSLFPDEKHYTFAGKHYSAREDHKRLSVQIEDVRKALSDGNWHTVQAIAERFGHPENSVSAQIRNLRKPDNGGHVIERRYRPGTKLSEYRMVLK